MDDVGSKNEIGAVYIVSINNFNFYLCPPES
jgi:hypothetical protein